MLASFPQMVSIVRHGSHGVSLLSWCLFLTNSIVWIVYGLRADSLSVVVGNVASAVAYLVLLVILVRSRTEAAWPYIAIPAWIVVVAEAANLLPLQINGLAGVILGTSLAVPQFFVTRRTMREHGESDSSIATWAMLWTGQWLWLAYGIIRQDLSLIMVNLLAGAVTGSVLFMELAIRRQQRRDAAQASAPQAESPGAAPLPLG